MCTLAASPTNYFPLEPVLDFGLTAGTARAGKISENKGELRRIAHTLPSTFAGELTCC